MNTIKYVGCAKSMQASNAILATEKYILYIKMCILKICVGNILCTNRKREMTYKTIRTIGEKEKFVIKIFVFEKQ